MDVSDFERKKLTVRAKNVIVQTKRDAWEYVNNDAKTETRL